MFFQRMPSKKAHVWYSCMTVHTNIHHSVISFSDKSSFVVRVRLGVQFQKFFFCLFNSNSYFMSQSFTIESQRSQLMCSCCMVRSRPEHSQHMCVKGPWPTAVWLIVNKDPFENSRAGLIKNNVNKAEVFLLSCLPKKEAAPPIELQTA